METTVDNKSKKYSFLLIIILISQLFVSAGIIGGGWFVYIIYKKIEDMGNIVGSIYENTKKQIREEFLTDFIRTFLPYGEIEFKYPQDTK
jgi:uncharacterized ion transporter superfamily protein YfcC